LGTSSGYIQNGPDGFVLWSSGTSTALDALAYGGAVSTVISGTTVNLVEGTATTATDSGTIVASLSRIPNGTDTNNASSDWRFTTCITPGAANMSCP
jgi:hypothetical protein